jgi:hypothetical protein
MTPGEDDGAEVLSLVDEHHDSIRARLTDEEYELLFRKLQLLADVPPDDDRAVRRAFQGVRLCLLPLPFDHPARAALDSVRLTDSGSAGWLTVLRAQALVDRLTTSYLSDPSSEDPLARIQQKQARLERLETDPSDQPDPSHSPHSPGSAAVIAAAESRLLRAPALSPAEARARCGGAAPPPELIRLADPDLGERYPEFQFEPGGGAPREVVLEVNRVLLADADPWGAADWWLSANAWLDHEPPATFLGVRSDRDLLDAAVALVEGD